MALMDILCPKCWSEMEATLAVCPSCAATVDLYSNDYERQLVSALNRSKAERRAQICWILGRRGKRSAIPILTELLHDPDLSVCEAAVRGLGEIGDASAAGAVEKLITSENSDLRSAARYVLRTLIGSRAGPWHPPAS